MPDRKSVVQVMSIEAGSQAEDGIRDHCVTGVQTCALPIWRGYPAGGAAAIAAGVAGVSKAGGYGGCATCGIASPQGVVSPQSVVAAPCDTCYTPKKHCFSM